MALVVFTTLMVYTQALLAAPIPDEETVKILPITPEVEAVVAKELEGYIPKGKATQAGTNKNGVYTLSGDLFDNGRIYAVIDSDPIVICEWKGHQWKAVLQLDATAAWQFPEWETQRPGREPKATKPFWVLHLQKRPLLVVAAGVEKEGQDYFVLLLNRKVTEILDIDHSMSAFSGTPVVMNEYLITTDHSRGKAGWGATYFSAIRRNKFVVKHSWEDFFPYFQPDESQFDGQVFCSLATSGSRSFTIAQDYYTKHHSADYVVYKGRFPDYDWKGILDGCKAHKPYAKLYFTDKEEDSQTAQQEIAYLFQHLTGLPRMFYRVESDYKPQGTLEFAGRINITGNREAVKLLSP